MNDTEQPRGNGETVQPAGADSAEPVEQAPEPVPEAAADGRPPAYPEDWSELDSRAVDTIRVLAMDAVQKTGNGHPGTAMSLAPVAYTLFQRTMRHDPAEDFEHPAIPAGHRLRRHVLYRLARSDFEAGRGQAARPPRAQ